VLAIWDYGVEVSCFGGAEWDGLFALEAEFWGFGILGLMGCCGVGFRHAGL
jgi:hypothetical protein